MTALKSLRFALLGAVFAGVSPLGCLLIKRFAVPDASPGFWPWIVNEARESSGIYLYLWLVTTALVFLVFGIWVGVLYGRLERKFAKLEKMKRVIEQIAMHDSLTGLGNYPGFMARLKEEMSRIVPDRPLSLLMIDVDNLKAINDRGGHLAGDSALQELGRAMEGLTRSRDYAARYGGDEFALILGATTRAQALKISARLYSELAKIRVMDSPLTISTGITTVESNSGIGAKDVVRQADMALYEAKEGGRNRIQVFGKLVTRLAE